MPTITCTSRLRDVGPQQAEQFAGHTVREVLAQARQHYPRLNDYLLDDQGAVRQHVAIFVDGQSLPRDQVLDVPLNPDADIYLMQALSGG